MAEFLRSPAILRIDPARSPVAAFRTILDEKLLQIKASVGPTLGGNPEALHRLRIALRGARATLRLFSPIIASSDLRSFDGDLQRVCRICGIARDWDVFCLETLPTAKLALPSSSFTALAAAACSRQIETHSAVAEEIESLAFTSLLGRLAALGHHAQMKISGHHRPTLMRSIGSSAPILLEKVAWQTAKRGRHVGRLSKRQLHTYRKSLDRLYDNASSFTGTFPGAAVATYRARCLELQEILGAANDTAVTKQLLAELSSAMKGEHAVPAKALARWNKQRRRLALKGSKRAHTRFERAARFWCEPPRRQTVTC